MLLSTIPAVVTSSCVPSILVPQGLWLFTSLERVLMTTLECTGGGQHGTDFEPEPRELPKSCDLCGQLQRCPMPDIENSRKTAEKGAEWVTVKQPKNSRENSPKHPEKQSKQLFFGCFGCFPGCFSACFTVTHGTLFGCFLFGCFSAVFNVGHLAPL